MLFNPSFRLLYSFCFFSFFFFLFVDFRVNIGAVFTSLLKEHKCSILFFFVRDFRDIISTFNSSKHTTSTCSTCRIIMKECSYCSFIIKFYFMTLENIHAFHQLHLVLDIIHLFRLLDVTSRIIFQQSPLRLVRQSIDIDWQIF